MEKYLAIKSNSLLAHITWMNFKDIMLSKYNHSQKSVCVSCVYMCMSICLPTYLSIYVSIKRLNLPNILKIIELV